MKSIAGWALVLVMTLAAPSLASELGSVENVGMQWLELDQVGDPGLLLAVDSLAAQGLFPKATPALRLLGGAETVIAVELEDRSQVQSLAAFYFLPDTRRYFFLRVQSDFLGRPEMRLWSRGPSEIVVTEEGIRLATKPSPESFRLDPEIERLAGLAPDAQVKDLSTTDIINCIARALNISINTSSLRDLINSATCSATNTISLFLLANTCLSVPAPAAIFGCTVGAAKLISCDTFNCSNSPGNDCTASIDFNQTTSGTWTSSCSATHRLLTYARYYTFTLSATTRVTIDLHSNHNSYLYLLEGNGTSGRVLQRDDNAGPGNDARIVRNLAPGTYTLEATTTLPFITGSFTIKVAR